MNDQMDEWWHGSSLEILWDPRRTLGYLSFTPDWNSASRSLKCNPERIVDKKGIKTRESQNTNLMQSPFILKNSFTWGFWIYVCEVKIYKRICKREKSFLEKLTPTGCYSGWEGKWVILQAKLHLGRLISSEKIKGTAMGYAGKWFILVCAYSCLNENARLPGILKMPGLGQGYQSRRSSIWTQARH